MTLDNTLTGDRSLTASKSFIFAEKLRKNLVGIIILVTFAAVFY